MVTTRRLVIDIKQQLARFLEGDVEIGSYPISSSANGTGFEIASIKTPLGKFKIYKKIGGGMIKGTVFKGRKPTGETADPATGHSLWTSQEDLILSRILWLEGAELGNANTRERYIYLHGTNHEDRLGQPASHGCIRMSNDHIIELFELVDDGLEVEIHD